MLTTGRYAHHEVFNESYSSQYDTSPFQTVPNSSSEGWGSSASSLAGSDMTVGGGSTPAHMTHPAFLHSTSRDTLQAHSYHTSAAANGDSKNLLQSAMLPGYSGKCNLID